MTRRKKGVKERDTTERIKQGNKSRGRERIKKKEIQWKKRKRKREAKLERKWEERKGKQMEERSRTENTTPKDRKENK